MDGYPSIHSLREHLVRSRFFGVTAILKGKANVL